MKTIETSRLELVELGSVTTDTQGAGGPVLEGFTYQPKTGISDD